MNRGQRTIPALADSPFRFPYRQEGNVDWHCCERRATMNSYDFNNNINIF